MAFSWTTVIAMSRIILLYLTIASLSVQAEICVENDTGLSSAKFSVAFVPNKDIEGLRPEFKHLENGAAYCIQTSVSAPQYLALYIEPLLSEPADHVSSQRVFLSKTAYSVAPNANLDFSVQILHPERLVRKSIEKWGLRKPFVTVGDGDKPVMVEMIPIYVSY